MPLSLPLPRTPAGILVPVPAPAPVPVPAGGEGLIASMLPPMVPTPSPWLYAVWPPRSKAFPSVYRGVAKFSLGGAPGTGNGRGLGRLADGLATTMGPACRVPRARTRPLFACTWLGRSKSTRAYLPRVLAVALSGGVRAHPGPVMLPGLACFLWGCPKFDLIAAATVVVAPASRVGPPLSFDPSWGRILVPWSEPEAFALAARASEFL